MAGGLPGRLARILLPPALIGVGAYFFTGSFEAYGNWAVYRHLGDFSGAEFYEVDFYLMTVPAVLCAALGCILIGRWWRR